MSIIITCGRLRPPATRKLTTLSRAAESEPPFLMMGLKSSMAPPKRSLFSIASRAPIQARLPESVLISPLCAMKRNGWARSQDGKVFVEKREWTIARRVTVRGSRRSG